MTPQVWKNLKSQFNKKSCENRRKKALNEEKLHSYLKTFANLFQVSGIKRSATCELGFRAFGDLLVTETLAVTKTRDFRRLLVDFKSNDKRTMWVPIVDLFNLLSRLFYGEVHLYVASQLPSCAHIAGLRDCKARCFIQAHKKRLWRRFCVLVSLKSTSLRSVTR